MQISTQCAMCANIFKLVGMNNNTQIKKYEKDGFFVITCSQLNFLRERKCLTKFSSISSFISLHPLTPSFPNPSPFFPLPSPSFRQERNPTNDNVDEYRRIFRSLFFSRIFSLKVLTCCWFLSTTLCISTNSWH